MANPEFMIIEAPSVLGLFPEGVETLPDALLGAGLAGRLGAERAARVEPLPYDDRIDPKTHMLNPQGIADYSLALAAALGPVFSAGKFPVVLGGDCSIILGCLLALKRRGRYGLLFIDGHADFYQPEAEENGEAASMDLALATGRGPAVVTDIEGARPLVRDEDVVAFGRRDAEEAEERGSQRIEDTNIKMIDGFWIHLDADVLDDAIMPAVDYRMPDGLSWDELVTVLRAVLATGRVIGIDITIFNPKLDSDGSVAKAFVDALARGLRS